MANRQCEQMALSSTHKLLKFSVVAGYSFDKAGLHIPPSRSLSGRDCKKKLGNEGLLPHPVSTTFKLAITRHMRFHFSGLKYGRKDRVLWTHHHLRTPIIVPECPTVVSLKVFDFCEGNTMQTYWLTDRSNGEATMVDADTIERLLGIEPGYLDWCIRIDGMFENGMWKAEFIGFHQNIRF